MIVNFRCLAEVCNFLTFFNALLNFVYCFFQLTCCLVCSMLLFFQNFSLSSGIGSVQLLRYLDNHLNYVLFHYLIAEGT